MKVFNGARGAVHIELWATDSANKIINRIRVRNDSEFISKLTLEQETRLTLHVDETFRLKLGISEFVPKREFYWILNPTSQSIRLSVNRI